MQPIQCQKCAKEKQAHYGALDVSPRSFFRSGHGVARFHIEAFSSNTDPPNPSELNPQQPRTLHCQVPHTRRANLHGSMDAAQLGNLWESCGACKMMYTVDRNMMDFGSIT